jgi:hypothetical protein
LCAHIRTVARSFAALCHPAGIRNQARRANGGWLGGRAGYLKPADKRLVCVLVCVASETRQRILERPWEFDLRHTLRRGLLHTYEHNANQTTTECRELMAE